MDRLAQNGLRHNQFHTTALCSPTRAALLTGRNHHSVGTGVIIEMGTGFPGYTGIVPNTTAGLPEMLRQNGYATAAFGKWHNTPDNEISPAGPFDRWPTGKTWGFEYFYGFMNGETHQYYPGALPQYRSGRRRRRHRSRATTSPRTWWTTRRVAQSVKATNPAKPWFMYFSTGAIHGPHHTPKAYREKYKGKFDAGWDKYREETFARQKQLGVVPPNAKLTPRPAEIPAWDDQPEEAKRVYRRLMENYSGFLDHTDEQVGRLLSAIEKSGQLENTLIFYIVGDNGASGEGGLEGTVNEVASLNGIQLGLKGLEDKFDEIGGPTTEPHVPVGLGLGRRHAIPVDQAGRIALRRHAQRPRHSLAEGHRRQGRAALAVPSRHRHRPDDAGCGRHQGAAGRQRRDAEADRGREHALLVRRCGGAFPPHDPILRDAGQPRNLQGRLDGVGPARTAAVADCGRRRLVR